MMQSHHSFDFVFLRTLSQAHEETAQIHPACVAEEDGTAWVVGVDEGAEERVEVVRGGGEIEEWWGGEGAVDVGVEVWHAVHRGGGEEEGCAEDADGGGGEGDFDGVVDVCIVDRGQLDVAGKWQRSV